MKKTMKPCILLLALLMTAAHLEARQIGYWPYRKLNAEAQIVVIAKPLSNVDTNDVFEGHENGYTGVNTEFQVEYAIKGDIGANKKYDCV